MKPGTSSLGRAHLRMAIATPLALAAALVCHVPAALAAEIDTGSDAKLRWDNTFKYSNAFRLKERSPTLLADPTLDDGDQAFGKGLISNRIDWLTEADVSVANFGARLSGAAWYDSVYNSSNDNASPNTVNAVGRAHDEFTQATRNLHGRKAELLDALVYGKFDLGESRTTVRLGRHAFLYGESLFFGNNGIAGGMAPIDVVKALSVPNTQFKELLRPVNQVSFQSQLNSTWAVGGYYQFKWEKHRLPGVDSYFGNADLVGTGAERILVIPQGATPVTPAGGTAFLRGDDIKAKNSGQGGLQLRFRPTDGNVDYGFYAIRYHEKGPQVYTAPNAAAGSDFTAASWGTYHLVYPQGINAYGASFSTTLGDANVGGEVSMRTNAPLVSHTGVMLPGVGGDNAGNPLYAVGKTAHAQVSAIAVVPGSALWDTASLVGEVAWNRTLSISKNALALDPATTRDAWGLRMIFEPQYFQVADGLDISVPFGLGYTPRGRSSAVVGFGVEHGGDMSLGLSADYLKVWKLSASVTHYLGAAGVIANTAVDIRTFKQTLKDRDFIAFSLTRTF